MAIFGRRKGGSSAARAARARKGHKRRMAKPLTSSHYRGSRSGRTKPGWFF